MNDLYLHDTMTREKRRFEPRDPTRVTMYVCGNTVYNYAHIGNARPVVVFDVLFRLLRRLYGEDAVVYARNITDVDDKINAKAAEEGVPIGTITERYIDAYHADMAILGALAPSLEPRATEHITDIIAMISRLVDNGAAYAAEGHVLFNIDSFPDYGQLSGRSLDDMIAGARVEVAPYKKNPADFVLWKPSKPSEPAWESPWGSGRPGWHIECSAMIEQALGVPIDIHGGGIDLVFPHHENENAQSRCADHVTVFTNYWMHNGFLNMGADKMSKSLGNVVLVHELTARYPGEAIRWALLSGHYRQPLEWTDELIEQSRKNLDSLYGALQRASLALRDATSTQLGHGDRTSVFVKERIEGFIENALNDDLNTPKAYAMLADAARQLNLAVDTRNLEDVAMLRSVISEWGGLLGFLQADPEAWFQGDADAPLKARIDGLIAARVDARRSKDWAAADRIRDELTALNVEVMDGAQGATWRFRDPGANPS